MAGKSRSSARCDLSQDETVSVLDNGRCKPDAPEALLPLRPDAKWVNHVLMPPAVMPPDPKIELSPRDLLTNAPDLVPVALVREPSPFEQGPQEVPLSSMETNNSLPYPALSQTALDGLVKILVSLPHP